jgi:monoterpene epsilon-lactone hydrolase
MASDTLREMSGMIRANYSENPIGDGDIETMRANMEAQSAMTPLPADVSRADIDMAGVPGCRIQAPGVRDDQAVLYLHGGGYVMGSGVDYRLAPESPWQAAGLPSRCSWP